MTTFAVKQWTFTIPLRFVEGQIPTEGEARALRLHLKKRPAKDKPEPVELEDLE